MKTHGSSIWVTITFLLIVTSLPMVGARIRSVGGSFVENQSTPATDYLIITSESMLDEVQPLAHWKTQRGLYTTIRTVEDITTQYHGSGLCQKIRNCIKDYYGNENTSWVLLAGGEDIVPTMTVVIDYNYISCDYYYANLDDNWNMLSNSLAQLVDINDWEAEVYVGRLPADTSVQMEDLVSRLIDYERDPPVGPWMKTALFAGAYASFDTDVNGNNIFDDDDWPGFDANRNHNWLSENIIPSDWNCIHLAETEGVQTTQYHYDYPLNETTLVEWVNSGASIFMSDGHGSETLTMRAIFTEDVDGDGLFDEGTDSLEGRAFLSTSTPLDVEGKLGMYFIAACSTGTFVAHECLTEYITRTSGIGCIGSSRSAYYDPDWYDGETLGWYTQGLSERFWRQIFSEDGNHPGKALSLAKEKYGADYVLLAPDKFDGGKTMTQYNLMGDPEVPLWLDIPSVLNVSIDLHNATRTISVLVDAGQTPVADAVVTMIGESIYQRALTDANGEAQLIMPDVGNITEVIITASRNGFIPSVVNISIGPSENTNGLDIVLVSVAIGMVALIAIVVYMLKKRA